MANVSVVAIIQAILSIISLVIFILCLTWLYKVKNNAKNEPTNRSSYISDDPLNYYIEGDFCYDNYLNYPSKGAFNIFDLRMKKIKKYAKALITTYLITVIVTVLTFIYSIVGEALFKNKKKCLAIFSLLIFLIVLVVSILSLVFFIILSVNYFKGKFDKFEDFSECKYLNNQFKSDYHFVSVVKDNFKKFFILNIIGIVLSCIKNIIDIISKKKQN